jgi:hypothetical protein
MEIVQNQSHLIQKKQSISAPVLWGLFLIFGLTNTFYLVVPLVREIAQNFEPFMLFLVICVFALVGLRSVYPLLFAWFEWKSEGEKRRKRQAKMIQIGWISVLLHFVVSLVVYPDFLRMYLFETVAGIIALLALTMINFVRNIISKSALIPSAAILFSFVYISLTIHSWASFSEIRSITVDYFSGLFVLDFSIGTISFYDVPLIVSLFFGDLVVVLPFLFLAVLPSE